MVSRDESRWAANPGGYGQTETVGFMTFNIFGLGAIGTHGRTLPWLQVRIVDPDGNELPPGETGEIVARGITVMNEYWNRPEENAAPPTRRLAPLARPRAPRSRRLDHIRGARDPHDQVGRREHLPGRGRGLHPGPPRSGRVRGDRHPRPQVGAEREGHRRARARFHDRRRRRDRALPRPHRVRTRSRAPSSSWMHCRARDSWWTTTRSTPRFGGGNYPGGRTRSA